jgi:DNA mismatch endonuclease (patch repair protein)
MDRLTPAHRSWNMSKIKSANTQPERLVRSLLHSMGFRFRLHRKDLPGKPDIVLPKYRTAIYVNGCFWHRHPNCKYAYSPKSRVAFWERKFSENVERDRKNQTALRKLSWRVITVWECESRSPERLTRRLQRLLVGNVKNRVATGISTSYTSK